MNYKTSFSAKLAKLRKENKLSLQALGDILGISNQAVSLLEKGKNAPSFEVLCGLANLFDVPIDYLIGRGLYAKADEINEHWDAIKAVMSPEFEEFGIMAMIEKADEITRLQILSAMVSDIQFSYDPLKISIAYAALSSQ